MTAGGERWRWRALRSPLLLAAGLLAAGALLRKFGGVPGTEWVDSSIRDEGLWGEVVFVSVGTALTAAGLPRQGIAFLGGYAFGAAIGSVLAGSPFEATLALRLLPVGNNLALNLLAGMAGLRMVPFLAGSAIGYLPQTIVFALLGKGIRVEGVAQFVMAGALLLVSVGLGLWLLRRHRAARAMEEG